MPCSLVPKAVIYLINRCFFITENLKRINNFFKYSKDKTIFNCFNFEYYNNKTIFAPWKVASY